MPVVRNSAMLYMGMENWRENHLNFHTGVSNRICTLSNDPKIVSKIVLTYFEHILDLLFYPKNGMIFLNLLLHNCGAT